MLVDVGLDNASMSPVNTAALILVHPVPLVRYREEPAHPLKREMNK